MNYSYVVEMRGGDMKAQTTPKAVKTDVGAKVAWNAYATLAEAEQVAEEARQRAVRYLAMGFDFGYSTPGEIRKDAEGLYWVTMP